MLAAVCALAFAPSAAAQGPETPQPQVSLLFAQSATRGSLEATACRCRGRRVLTLRGVAAQVVWFQDRPERHAGQLPAREFARLWAWFGFPAEPPNAALTLLDGARSADTVVVELLSRPRYDRKRHTMRYVVRLLSQATGNLADFQAGLDSHVPRRFGAASLFIDAAVVRQTSARHLGSGRWRVELN